MGMGMDEKSPQDQAFEAVAGYWVSQTLFAAAKLGVADRIGDDLRTAAEVAKALGTHEPSTLRLLRALVTAGAVRAEGGRYGLTPFGQTLRKGVPGSMRSFFLGVMADDHRRAWASLDHSVKTGETAFDHVFGVPVFDYYASHPEVAADFNDAMTAGSAAVEAAVLAAFDFTPFGRIVDVGGGNGGFLSAILDAAPKSEGVLFDTPPGLTGAKDLIKARGVSGRCEIVPGDFFGTVPGGDLTVLKWILHDWDDRRSSAILSNCRKSAPPGSRIMIVEVVLPDGDEPTFGRLGDLNMMVMTGGRERSAAEFRALLAGAGYADVRVIPTRSPFAIIEARAAG